MIDTIILTILAWWIFQRFLATTLGACCCGPILNCCNGITLPTTLFGSFTGVGCSVDPFGITLDYYADLSDWTPNTPGCAAAGTDPGWAGSTTVTHPSFPGQTIYVDMILSPCLLGDGCPDPPYWIFRGSMCCFRVPGTGANVSEAVVLVLHTDDCTDCDPFHLSGNTSTWFSNCMCLFGNIAIDITD